MGANPSLELNISNYMSALALITKKQKSIPILNLEPQFSPIDEFLNLKRDSAGIEPVNYTLKDGNSKVKVL